MTRRTDAAAVRMLDLARDSLADARLLMEHERRNQALLLDLALKQALAAISLLIGQDAPDGLPLDTLLGRVPADHPGSALAGRLADPRARDADTVGRLIDAVSPARTQIPAEPEASTTPRRPTDRRPAKPAGRPGSEQPRADAAPPGRGAVVAGGPTAFEAAARAHARPPDGNDADATERTTSSTAFWALMDRWAVSDQEALDLLGGAHGLTRKGTRPRFRLRGEEAARFATLRRIDTALELLGETPDWLSRPRKEAPFASRTPLAGLLADPDGAGAAILHALNRAGLRAEIARSG